MPICQFAKAKHCASFKGEAQYGYCAVSVQTYYGFQRQVLIFIRGLLT